MSPVRRGLAPDHGRIRADRVTPPVGWLMIRRCVVDVPSGRVTFLSRDRLVMRKWRRGTAQHHVPTEEEIMVLATAKIGDFDRFWNTFSTKGAEKRKQHGCKGAHLFRDPNESDRVWAIFDWDEAGWQSFTSDPEVPAIFQEAGFTQGPPKSAEFLRQHDA